MAIATVEGVFDATQDTLAVTWSGITTNPPAVTSGVGTGDGSVVVVNIVAGTLSNTGCTLEPTARFVGLVELVIED